jgi:hypothetical protein
LSYQTAIRKTFRLRLSAHYLEYFRIYAFVYRHLLERLGRTVVEDLWRDADADAEDRLFAALVREGWTEELTSADLATERHELMLRLFTPAVQGVTAEEAMQFMLSIVPFRSFEAAFPKLSAQRDVTTTYEALHLFMHGMACFAEEGIARVGKAAEFMIYDGLIEEIADRLSPQTTGREWIRAIFDRTQGKPGDPSASGKPPELTMGSAGHAEEVVRVVEDELIVRMTQCSWAEYYLDRHPRVGQLLGCCVDDPVYRRTAQGLRLQRRHTLMDGGPYCDFRFHAAAS